MKHLNLFLFLALISVPTTFLFAQPSANARGRQVDTKATAESGGTISVAVVGVGKDKDTALKDALRAAVEQAVGSLVDAKTLVVNDDLVQDKILTFSGGFVQSYKPMGEPRTRDDGLVSVRITAEVKRGELDTQLQKAGLIGKSVDWEGLFAERFTRMQSLEDGTDMLVWMIEEYILNCISVKAGGTRWDQEKRKVILEIQTSVDYEKYSAFTKRFMEVLQKMGVKRDGEGALQLTRIDRPQYRFMWTGKGVSGGYRQGSPLTTEMRAIGRDRRLASISEANRSFYIATNRWRALVDSGAKKQEKFVRYSPPREVFEEVRNSLLAIKSKNIIVELLDDRGKIVVKDKVLSFCPCYVDRRSDQAAVLLFPSLFKDGYAEVACNVWPGTPEYKEEIELDIPMDDMKKVHKIQFRYE